MKFNVLVYLLIFFSLTGCDKNNKDTATTAKPALMWFDATANFERFSYPDSISFYLKKIKALGFTHAIVDVRPISGEVLYKSAYAPEMKEWHGFERNNFDYLGCFVNEGHKLGLKIMASLNVFVAGHNYFDRGIIYSNHPEWASVVYNPEKGIIPITEEKNKYGAMVNPVNKDYQEYILNILKEVTGQYPSLDGIMLDRVRYDGLEADFSDMSKSMFEAYAGEKITHYPADIYEWEKTPDGKYQPKRGTYFKKWVEWRAKNIYDFMALARKEVKTVNPKIIFGTYTGAWYPSYYEVGVNFASNTYDPSKDYDWATPEYKNYGYAGLIDLYATGNYYTNITKEEYCKANSIVVNETDSRGHSGTWYCVEGSCEQLRHIMGPNKFIGGVLVDQFYPSPQKLAEAIEMNLKASDGLMVFDITHIVHKNLWAEVEEGMEKGGQLKK